MNFHVSVSASVGRYGDRWTGECGKAGGSAPRWRCSRWPAGTHLPLVQTTAPRPCRRPRARRPSPSCLRRQRLRRRLSRSIRRRRRSPSRLKPWFHRRYHRWYRTHRTRFPPPTRPRCRRPRRHRRLRRSRLWERILRPRRRRHRTRRRPLRFRRPPNRSIPPVILRVIIQLKIQTTQRAMRPIPLHRLGSGTGRGTAHPRSRRSASTATSR